MLIPMLSKRKSKSFRQCLLLLVFMLMVMVMLIFGVEG